MQEPNWEELGADYYNSPAGIKSLVWTVKKTRGRFGAATPAIPGDHGLVISRWVSSMGSEKISFVTSDLRQLATTAACTRLWGGLNDKTTAQSIKRKWQDIHLQWIDQTYVPIFVTRERMTSRRPRSKFVVSRNGSSILVKPVFAKQISGGLWLKREWVHPRDWKLMMGSNLDEATHSLRVPEWVAKKAGIF